MPDDKSAIFAIHQENRPRTVLYKDGLSEKMLAPNAAQYRNVSIQRNRLKSLTDNESVDLGDGMFLLSDKVDPSSILLEVKVSAGQWTTLVSAFYLSELQKISKLVYNKFNDDFDVIFFVLNTPFDNNIINSLGFYGMNIDVSNDVQGIGKNISKNDPAIWGLNNKLKSVIFFPYYDAILTGPALHELCHNWAAFICPTYTPDNLPYYAHWGMSNAGGQLGGFKYVRVVEENSGGIPGKTLYQASFKSNSIKPDGSFVYGGFGIQANGGNSLPYSDIELYLMGMKSEQELRNTGFHLDIYSGNDFNNSGVYSLGSGYFYSSTKTSYTIDDIITMNGVRVPDVSTSQKQFKVLTVAITPEMATENFSETIIQNISWLAGSMDDATFKDLYNFRQATSNIGSLIVSDVKTSCKLELGGETSSLSVSPTSLSFAATGEQKSFTVTSNIAWIAVSSDPTWLTVSPSSGNNNGIVTVTVSANTSTSQRTATILVSGTGITTKTISVTQETSQNGVQTWNLSPTMTAKLNNSGVLTITTTRNAEAMQNYYYDAVPWYNVRQKILSVIIEDKVTTIGNSSFWDCNNLTTVLIPNSVISIGNLAFINNSRLSSITIPNSVKSIGYSAFSGCQNLTEITIPKSVETIYNDAFSCTGLSSITIPNAVRFYQFCGPGLPRNAFHSCENLTTIEVEDGNNFYFSENGVLFNKNKTTLIAFPAGKSGIYTIPSSVKVIEPQAFEGCNRLTDIMFPNSVEEIHNAACWACDRLNSIRIPSSISYIGNQAFNYCKNLKRVTVEWTKTLPLTGEQKWIFIDGNKEGWLVEYTKDRTLYVPAGSKSLYETAEEWKNFGTIVEYNFTSSAHIDIPTFKTYASNGILYISGIQVGEPLYVYNLAGQLVYNDIVNSETAVIPLYVRGFYVIKTENQTIKVFVE